MHREADVLEASSGSRIGPAGAPFCELNESVEADEHRSHRQMRNRADAARRRRRAQVTPLAEESCRRGAKRRDDVSVCAAEPTSQTGDGSAHGAVFVLLWVRGSHGDLALFHRARLGCKSRFVWDGPRWTIDRYSSAQSTAGRHQRRIRSSKRSFALGDGWEQGLCLFAHQSGPGTVHDVHSIRRRCDHAMGFRVVGARPVKMACRAQSDGALAWGAWRRMLSAKEGGGARAYRFTCGRAAKLAGMELLVIAAPWD